MTRITIPGGKNTNCSSLLEAITHFQTFPILRSTTLTRPYSEVPVSQHLRQQQEVHISSRYVSGDELCIGPKRGSAKSERESGSEDEHPITIDLKGKIFISSPILFYIIVIL